MDSHEIAKEITIKLLDRVNLNVFEVKKSNNKVQKLADETGEIYETIYSHVRKTFEK